MSKKEMDLDEAWMDSYEKYKSAKLAGDQDKMVEHYKALNRIETKLHTIAFEAETNKG